VRGGGRGGEDRKGPQGGRGGGGKKDRLERGEEGGRVDVRLKGQREKEGRKER